MSNEPALPRGFLRRCVLLLLGERQSHGYDIVERLQSFGFDGSDPGGVYRTLRTLEHEGLVRSDWEPSGVGPHRRVYLLTDPGLDELTREADELVHSHDILFNYLARYRRLKKGRERDEMWPAAAGYPRPAPGSSPAPR